MRGSLGQRESGPRTNGISIGSSAFAGFSRRGAVLKRSGGRLKQDLDKDF